MEKELALSFFLFLILVLVVSSRRWLIIQLIIIASYFYVAGSDSLFFLKTTIILGLLCICGQYNSALDGIIRHRQTKLGGCFNYFQIFF